jgi:hypothetical protein
VQRGRGAAVLDGFDSFCSEEFMENLIMPGIEAILHQGHARSACEQRE